MLARLMTTPLAPPHDPRAALPRLDRHKPKCGPVRKSKSSRRRAWVLIGVHVLVGVHIAQWLITGSTLTPVEPSEAMHAFERGLVNAGFVLFAVLILGTLVFGRWFCGWACHVVALQDLSAWLLGKLGLRPRPVRSRLLVLAPFVVAFAMFGMPHVNHWLDPQKKPMPRLADWEWHVTTDDLWETFPGPLMAVLTFVVVGFLIVWWLGAKGFCTYGCPYGAFFVVADRLSPGKIKVTDACDACGHCTSVCTSNVRVHEEVAIHKQVVDPACMKCLDCVSVCPKGALYYGFTSPKPFQKSQQRIKARADFTWPEELALATVAFAATLGFRGAWFGENIPFLMSVGLGVITAAMALLGWRLLRRPDVTFQHTVLKRAGVRTRAGRWATAATAAWVLFALHSGVLNRFARSALNEAYVAFGEFRQSGAPARLVAAAEGLAAVDRWALWTPSEVLGLHGYVLRALGKHDLAIRQLERFDARRGLDPEGYEIPRFDNALADYYLKAGRFDEAERLVRGVLAVHPQDPTALELLRRLGR
jgi:ferredoxin